MYLIGNGGSYANAAHIANDLLSVGVRAHTMEAATLTAFANDFGYENAFAKWLGIMADRGDMLMALSGSGKSANILNAVKKAEEIGMEVMEVYGAREGHDMQRAEELQVELGHNFMRALR